MEDFQPRRAAPGRGSATEQSDRPAGIQTDWHRGLRTGAVHQPKLEMKEGVFIALLFLWSAVTPAFAQDAAVAKARAYELYQAKRFNVAAQQFKAYFDTNPNDPTAMIDYASLLSELARHDEAAKLLETIHQKAPENETAAFKLAVEYAALKRYADADKIFAELEKSNNPAIASAAADSSKKAKDDQRREARFKAEQHVYDLANQFKYQDVINAVGELEKEPEPLSFTLQMQRLYALQSLHQYAMALDRANQLATANPNQPDLALLRAELLVQLGRRPEAEALWREVKQKFQGTPAAAQASQRLARPASGSLAASPEDHIYDLARQRKHREVIAAVNELEEKRPLSLQMQMQRLYSYQALGESQRALQQIDQIAAAHSNSTELAFMKSDLL